MLAIVLSLLQFASISAHNHGLIQKGRSLDDFKKDFSHHFSKFVQSVQDTDDDNDTNDGEEISKTTTTTATNTKAPQILKGGSKQASNEFN